MALAPLVLHTGVSSQESHEPPQPEWLSVPETTARLDETDLALVLDVVLSGHAPPSWLAPALAGVGKPALLALSAQGPGRADRWPMFRGGPSLQGVADALGQPDRLDPVLMERMMGIVPHLTRAREAFRAQASGVGR